MAESSSSAARRPSYTTNPPRRPSYASVLTGTQPTPSWTQPTTSHERSFSSSSQRPTIPPFWVPEYLKGSRYARKLQSVYESRIQTLRDSQPRITPSHRGMTYDIIETPPPTDDILPLPSRLSSTDKHSGLDLVNDNEVKFQGSQGKELEAASIRSDYPISPQVGIYYYEIHIKHKPKDCAVAIGFSGPTFSLERLPGWEPNSWAYHGDDGKVFEGQSNGQIYRTGFGQHNTIGCGIDFSKKLAWFTKDGQDLQVAFRNVQFPSQVFPCIGMKKQPGVQISVNFGQSPFVYDIVEKIAVEQDKVENEILGTGISRLCRDFGEMGFMQELIGQFLGHGGYIESGMAFQRQVERERGLLGEQGVTVDVGDARIRQDVRRAVLSGKIDEALKLVEEEFPRVLEDTGLVFRLRCRKFLELVAKAAEVRDAEMEVDGKGEGEYDRLNGEAILYGQELKTEFGEEHEKYLDEVFSLMGYPDPAKSPNGYLLDESGRTKVAEELNSAILTSTGRAPTAAVETIWRQAEAMVEVLSQDGGPAAFVIGLQDEPFEV